MAKEVYQFLAVYNCDNSRLRIDMLDMRCRMNGRTAHIQHIFINLIEKQTGVNDRMRMKRNVVETLMISGANREQLRKMRK